MKRLIKNERGQVLAITAISIVALLAMTAFVTDVGAWFREHRHAQAVADAAALAGAQALPDTGTASSLALQYAGQNGGGVSSGDVTFQSQYTQNDTIAVKSNATSSGFFARIFGISSVKINATAKARSGLPSAARYVAPIAVNCEHPMLGCDPPSVQTDPTSITLANLHQPGGGDAAGSFSLLDLRSGGGGTAGESEVADWMANGYDELMPLGTYDAEPSAMFNGSQFQDAIESMIGKEVLLPVYEPPVIKSGSNAQFNIIGWVGFLITGVSGGGAGAKIYGHFTNFIAQGIQGTGSSGTDFGVRVVQLVE